MSYDQVEVTIARDSPSLRPLPSSSHVNLDWPSSTEVLFSDDGLQDAARSVSIVDSGGGELTGISKVGEPHHFGGEGNHSERLPVQGLSSSEMEIDETYVTGTSESSFAIVGARGFATTAEEARAVTSELSVVAVEAYEFATAVRNARRTAIGKQSPSAGLNTSSQALRAAVKANNV